MMCVTDNEWRPIAEIATYAAVELDRLRLRRPYAVERIKAFLALLPATEAEARSSVAGAIFMVASDIALAQGKRHVLDVVRMLSDEREVLVRVLEDGTDALRQEAVLARDFALAVARCASARAGCR